MRPALGALLLLFTLDAQAQDSARASGAFATTPDGVRLRYVIAGAGRDTVIVPLASWLDRDLAWLADGRVVVFYDPRGRGGSSLPGDSAAFGWRADINDMEAIRRHLRIERAALVGTSYYAAIVALYAAHYPTRVRRVVMVAPQRPAFDTRYRFTRTSRQALDTTVVRALEDMRRAGLDGVDPQGFCRADVSARLVPSQMGDPDLAATM